MPERCVRQRRSICRLPSNASLKIPEKCSLEHPAAYVQKSPSSGGFYVFFSVIFHRIARYDRLTYETPSKGRGCDDLDAELLRGLQETNGLALDGQGEEYSTRIVAIGWMKPRSRRARGV